MADANPPTQSEILARHNAEVDRLHGLVNTLFALLNNPEDAPVETDSGSIPSFRGLQEEIRRRIGPRIYNTVWSGEDLARYAGGAEIMLRSITTVPVMLSKTLEGSYFRLATASAQPIVLAIQWGTATYTVTFAANSTTGTITATNVGDEGLIVGLGEMLTLRMTSPAWTAAGLAVVIAGLIDYQPAAG